MPDRHQNSIWLASCHQYWNPWHNLTEPYQQLAVLLRVLSGPLSQPIFSTIWFESPLPGSSAQVSPWLYGKTLCKTLTVLIQIPAVVKKQVPTSLGLRRSTPASWACLLLLPSALWNLDPSDHSTHRPTHTEPSGRRHWVEDVEGTPTMVCFVIQVLGLCINHYLPY
jgi:hypothetical protein